jgi:Leu/Phe-tRNA-protein transferase
MPPNAKQGPPGASAEGGVDGTQDSNSSNNSNTNSNSNTAATGTTSATTARRTGSLKTGSSSNNSNNNSNNSRQERTLQSYIPFYLRRYVMPYHGDFCYTPHFHPTIIVQLMAEGFLPIATTGMLLPKLHEQRCVVLNNSNTDSHTGANNASSPLPALPSSPSSPSSSPSLHVSKQARKKARRFFMSVNTAFDKVVEGCRQQHGVNCWLYPELVQAFRAMYQGTIQHRPLQAVKLALRKTKSRSRSAAATSAAAAATSGEASASRTTCTCPVRLYSIEIWSNDENNDDDDVDMIHEASDSNGVKKKDNWVLVGGELGYTVGTIYTSLTGFSSRDSAGSVQLAALGKLIFAAGFTVWDLGMAMEYKSSLGAQLVPRDDFVRMVHEAREMENERGLSVQLPVPATKVNARSMIDDPMNACMNR